ncbi:TatD family hydrolase [Candidatus Erwinia haradaeae]|uniref:3'-5' ssDNA/RNA exonuclease TatD n=1 Tax=Candidatus Erwinia haradaeae TaxID=1922217 RepID=A0A451D2C3_9GAMM|nr:TatD family hydrolase [Candidatus Erwinia haradaeae]VFP79785.1 3'-5' ssDNA/RNA exonuclease TatD [Candidatus Erwinia haradaeae]
MLDVGVNLTHEKFSKDRIEVVLRARTAGITGMIIISSTVSDSRQSIMIAKQDTKYFWCTVGVHPHYAYTWSKESRTEICKLINEPSVVAIGECGLDFYRSFSTRKQQVYVFQEQIELAVEFSMPLFLHCRDAHQCFMSILKPWLPNLRSVLLHCFTGTRSELELCLEYDISIGVTGWICDPYRGRELSKLIPLIPSNRLLIETDAPWLFPKDIQLVSAKKRNEPCFLPHIMETVAKLRKDDITELSQKIINNTCNLFHLA